MRLKGRRCTVVVEVDGDTASRLDGLPADVGDGAANLLGVEPLGLDHQATEVEALTRGMEEGGIDADLALLGDERLDQSQVVLEQDGLDGVEQRVKGDVAVFEAGVYFVGLDVVELCESGD